MIEQRINKIKLKLKPGQAYFAFSYENPVSAVDTFYLSGFASSFAGILVGPRILVATLLTIYILTMSELSLRAFSIKL
jgi:hypothetical protein